MTAPFLGAGDRAVQFVAGALGLVVAGYVAGVSRHLSGGTLLAIVLAVGGLLLLADASRGRSLRLPSGRVEIDGDVFVDPVLITVVCADRTVAITTFVPSAGVRPLTNAEAAGLLRGVAQTLLEQPRRRRLDHGRGRPMSAPQVGDVITTAEGLDALPERAVVLDREGAAAQRVDGRWYYAIVAPHVVLAPFTVVALPGHPPRPERVVKAQAIREAAWAVGDEAASSDYLADEVSDDGIMWFLEQLRDRADRVEVALPPARRPAGVPAIPHRPELSLPQRASGGVSAIATERARQISDEGYAPEHDAEHGWHVLAQAGACYAEHIADHLAAVGSDVVVHPSWPWSVRDWKPSRQDPRRQLVKAGALIAAAIDVLDAQTGEPR